MNNQNYVHPVKSFIRFNNPHERWRRMGDLIDGNYYISSEGRVMRMTPNGIFKEIKTVVQGGHLIVGLNGKSNTRFQLYRVSRLVLTYFKGGYYRGRRIGYKNNDKKDCRLKNLYWFQGFTKTVDYKYLKKLKPSTLDVEDVLVVEYFLKNDIKKLFDLVEKCIPKLFTALKNKGIYFDFKNDISSIVLQLSEDLREGKYKPVSNLVRYKKQDFINYLINMVLKMATEDLKHVFIASERLMDNYCLKID
nr:hypothetical protein BACY1_08550 [Tenacibaculum mesophilum]